MGLRFTTVLRFLVGQKAAIEEIAADRGALWAGFAFCLSTAFARHYDGKCLVREPWFLLAPAGAALLTSSVLFAAMYLVIAIKSRRIQRGYGQAYLSFLGLYLMTAPLAWLYGIPYERFLNEVDAVQARIWVLGLVTIWRVVLMSRVFSVLIPCSFFSAFSKLGTFALALFYTALMFARVPLISIMGGVRVPPSAEPVIMAYLYVMFYGFFALVIGGIGLLVSIRIRQPDWSLKGFVPVEHRTTASRQLLIAALSVTLVFGAAMPITQREQWLRYQVEAEYKSGNIDRALMTLSMHSRTEFPPQWTPPPWPEYEDGARDPKFHQIVQALQSRQDIPLWVTAAYGEKAKLYLGNNGSLSQEARVMLQNFVEQQSEKTGPVNESETDKVPLRVEFSNPQRAFLAVETTLGPNQCSANPVLHTQELNGDAGWVLTAFAKDSDKLCYRVSDLKGVGWGEWHEVGRQKSGQNEVYGVTLHR
ncbi:MAG: hypothetical protein ABSG25_09780 [Bryobacteraceae bacterium]